MSAPHPRTWLKALPQGLFVEPGGFFIDPLRPVERAVVTHAHSDHARAGNSHVLATPETCVFMRHRLGDLAGTLQPLRPGETLVVGEVALRLVPAGHVLGSAQVVLEHRGSRAVVSGDYKRRGDLTCQAFEPVSCDVFVTEATFALPVFRHPPDRAEIGRLLHSLALFPERSHLVGVYALGKCQRVLSLLREAGYAEPVHIHGALAGMCELYRELGVALGPLAPVSGRPGEDLRGRIVLAPPSALQDRWTRRLPDPLPAMASGWMRVKQRAKQMGVELALVISDHADWDELTQTLADVGAPDVWVTHGRDEAIAHQAAAMGIRARALDMVGYEENEA